MSTELKQLLYHQICADFEKAIHDVEENLPRYRELLLKIHEAGSWSVTVTVQGEDVANATLKEFHLLENAQIVEGRFKFTHRNIAKIFTLAEQGRKLVDKIRTEGMEQNPQEI